jgi:hypothetical protein
MAASTIHDIVGDFNHILKILTQDLARRYPHDATVYRARTRVITVIDVDPLFVIKTVGPYLYKYREQIYGLTDDPATHTFFLENTYDTELKAAVNREKADMVSYILPMVKECARSLPPREKQEYIGQVVSLLDGYVEYLAAMAGLP